jgi:hypothetical protein
MQQPKEMFSTILQGERLSNVLGATMNKIAVTAAAITTLIASHALAGDMAVKAPAPAPAPVYNWTGWYVGVNAGARMLKPISAPLA